MTNIENRMTNEIQRPTEQRLRVHQQEQLLRWWDELNSEQRHVLAGQIAEIDFAQIAGLWRPSGTGAVEEPPARKALRAVPPAHLVRTPATQSDRMEWAKAQE